MNYEEKYKEALERAKKLHDSYNLMHISVDEIEQIFPELAESEDERIRKQLIDAIKIGRSNSGISFTEEAASRYIAYLEKQKEQKPTDDVLHRTYQEGFNDGLNYRLEGTGVKYVKDNPKQEWSEEDEEVRETIIAAITAANMSTDCKKQVKNWLKSLKPHWKPSEEQMEALKDAVKLYKETHFERFHDRIVSLYEQLKKL